MPSHATFGISMRQFISSAIAATQTNQDRGVKTKSMPMLLPAAAEFSSQRALTAKQRSMACNDWGDHFQEASRPPSMSKLMRTLRTQSHFSIVQQTVTSASCTSVLTWHAAVRPDTALACSPAD